MKHRFSRFLTFLLVVFASILPVSAIEIDGINYVLDSESLTASVGANRDFTGDCIIPSSVSYQDTDYPVTEILSRAFASCNGLTSIAIPKSIKTIYGEAFSNCKNRQVGHLG